MPFRFEQKEFPGGRTEIARLKNGLGKLSYEERMVALVLRSLPFVGSVDPFCCNCSSPNWTTPSLQLFFLWYCLSFPPKIEREC